MEKETIPVESPDIHRETGRKGGAAVFSTPAVSPVGAAVPVEQTVGLNKRAAVWAGLIGGAVFMLLEMLLVPLINGGSMWGPPRMIAAIALGKGVLPPPATFDFGVLMTAMGIHFVLSVVFAFALAWIIQRVGTGAALLIGAVFGLGLYLVNFYGFTAVFPWFAMARNGVTIFTHVMFGVIAAWMYKAIAQPLASRV